MRKSALVLALVMVATAPTAVLAAPKAKTPQDPNWAGKKFVMTGMMQPYYAWQSVWAPQPAKKKK